MKEMNNELKAIKKEIYDKCSFQVTRLENEPEGKEYGACHYRLDEMTVFSRNGKITPKKVGQFVSFWKRNGNGIIEPFEETDRIDFFLVNVKDENQFGHFVFPLSVLIKKGILSTASKEGKRAFRVYPPWCSVSSKQAERTQNWQLEYFLEVNNSTDINRAKELYVHTLLKL